MWKNEYFTTEWKVNICNGTARIYGWECEFPVKCIRMHSEAHTNQMHRSHNESREMLASETHH